jgi:hypothetical protein
MRFEIRSTKFEIRNNIEILGFKLPACCHSGRAFSERRISRLKVRCFAQHDMEVFFGKFDFGRSDSLLGSRTGLFCPSPVEVLLRRMGMSKFDI